MICMLAMIPLWVLDRNVQRATMSDVCVFGGFARVATAVSRARAEGSVLYFNAGDTFYGTVWYAIYRAELAGQLMNMLNPDAMSLGNHEFDDNIAGLVPFLKQLNFPVVSCNLDLTFVPKLANIKQLVSSTIISRLDRRIGVIGYLTPLTKYYVPYNLVAYWPEIPAINMEAKKLRSAGVDIIIALGHSGYEVDMKIAKNCPDVDVVIGGHSHTFLYTGNPPVNDLVEGDYPTVITRSNGQQVPVLQAFAYTKYLGRINLEFDEQGNLLNFNGAPILLDCSIPRKSDVVALLNSKRHVIDYIHKSNRSSKWSKLLQVSHPAYQDIEVLKKSGAHAADALIVILLQMLVLLLLN